MMSLPIEYIADHEGQPRARWTGEDRAGTTLADFLETDLGFHRAFGARILDEGRHIVSAREGAYMASGNVFSLAIGPETTFLAPLSDRIAVEAIALPTPVFLDAVDRWCDFLDEIDEDLLD